MLLTLNLSSFQSRNLKGIVPSLVCLLGVIFWSRMLKRRVVMQTRLLSEALVSKEREMKIRIWAEVALRESEAQLRAIFDTTPFPIALVDTRDAKIEFWSRSALTLFGHTAPTLPEWYQIAYPDPDYRREMIARWKPFLEKARLSGQGVNTGEYRIACRDGSER
ncbi:MAG: PAS domain-containing protein, partial [Terrimicrobiaceae bacterium]